MERRKKAGSTKAIYSNRKKGVIKMENFVITKKIKSLIVVAILLIVFLIFNPFFIVGPGQVGITFSRFTGQMVSYSQGLHVLMPLVQYATKMDIRTQKLEVEAVSYSKDIQTATAKIALNYHILPEKADKLFRDVGKDYDNRIIQPAIQESVKATAAQFTAQELVEQRPKVKEEIKTFLKERLQNWNIIVDEFSIANFDFTPEYEKAVEQKQVAQQNALTEKNNLEAKKFLAEQILVKAKADAEAIKIQAQAITQQGGKDYVNLKAVDKWDGKLPQIVAGDKGMFLMDIGNK